MERRTTSDRQTVHGIGNRKNEYFVEYLVRYGAEPYPTTVSFVKDMRSRGYRMALFTASKNADKVLESSGLRDLFEVVVDGNDARELGLKGKPSPDIILEAARRLGVSADRAVVIEDALAGVEAGSAGGFATVIGVDRGDQANELRAHVLTLSGTCPNWLSKASEGPRHGCPRPWPTRTGYSAR